MCRPRFSNSARMPATQVWSPFNASARAHWVKVAAPLVDWLCSLAIASMIGLGPAA
jgi:hypothetical protein